MVGELIVKHDRVGLPGVGTFVAEMVPATFSDKGYTINPPYRRLSFSPSQQEDSLLIDMYAQANQIARDAASSYVTEYLAELKSVLEQRKSVVLPGLGRLRATRENTLFFVPNEDLDIFPAGVGLQPVSLKSHVLEEEPVVIDVPVPTITEEVEPVEIPEPMQPEETETTEATEAEEVEELEAVEEIAEAEEVAEAAETAEATETAEEPEASEEVPAAEEVPVAEEEATETLPEQAEDAHDPDGRDGWIYADWHHPEEEEVRPRSGWGTFFIILGILLLLFGLFIGVSRLFPGSTDFLLYSPEELDILNR